MAQSRYVRDLDGSCRGSLSSSGRYTCCRPGPSSSRPLTQRSSAWTRFCLGRSEGYSSEDEPQRWDTSASWNIRRRREVTRIESLPIRPGACHAYVASFHCGTRADRRLCLRKLIVTDDITLTNPLTGAGTRVRRIGLIGLHPIRRAVAWESGLCALSADGRGRDDGHVDEQRRHFAYDDIECIGMGLWNDSARWTVLAHVQHVRNVRVSLQHSSRHDGHDRRSMSKAGLDITAGP